jgi:hypothetical protein
LFAIRCCYAGILATSSSVRPDNGLIVDIRVTTDTIVGQLAVAYQAEGVEPLLSKVTPISTAGATTITIGRLRANTKYIYTVSAADNQGAPAGTAEGCFTTGSLPPALLLNTFTLQGRTTVPLVILPLLIRPPSLGLDGFRGYVALDLHSSDAPQIVWYYSNAASTASGILQPDPVGSIFQEPNGTFLFADAGSGPPPSAADSFYREITADGRVLGASPSDCSITPPPAPSPGWIWGAGNDVPELLPRGTDGVPAEIFHLGKIVKDPFSDAGMAAPGARLQMGATIRRWNAAAGTDEVVWNSFDFMDPLRERTTAANADPGANSDSRGPMACTGASLLVEDWMHANSLQFAPTGDLLMSVRHLDTVLAISPAFQRITWRIGGQGSDFAFPNSADRFYHQHFVRMLENGNLLLMDNGNGRPADEGGPYSRALELSLDWASMTANKVWEYRHESKYADKVGSAQRLANGNTLVLFGADIDPATLLVKDPQTFALVEADASPEGAALAVLDMQIQGNFPIYRVLPVQTLFGETPNADSLLSRFRRKSEAPARR